MALVSNGRFCKRYLERSNLEPNFGELGPPNGEKQKYIKNGVGGKLGRVGVRVDSDEGGMRLGVG